MASCCSVHPGSHRLLGALKSPVSTVPPCQMIHYHLTFWAGLSLDSVFLIIAIDSPCNLLFSSPNISDDNVIIATIAQIHLLLHCKAASLVHCHPNSFSVSYFVFCVPDFKSFSLSWWFLQAHYIHPSFHPHLQCHYCPLVWPGTVVLNCSNQWKQQLPWMQGFLNDIYSQKWISTCWINNST